MWWIRGGGSCGGSRGRVVAAGALAFVPSIGVEGGLSASDGVVVGRSGKSSRWAFWRRGRWTAALMGTGMPAAYSTWRRGRRG